MDGFHWIMQREFNRNKDLPGSENAAGHFFFGLLDKFPKSPKDKGENPLIA